MKWGIAWLQFLVNSHVRKIPRCEKGEKYLYGTLDGSNGVVCYDQKGKAKEVNYYYSDDNIGSYYLHFDIQNDKISLIVLGVITI